MFIVVFVDKKFVKSYGLLNTKWPEGRCRSAYARFYRRKFIFNNSYLPVVFVGIKPDRFVSGFLEILKRTIFLRRIFFIAMTVIFFRRVNAGTFCSFGGKKNPLAGDQILPKFVQKV